MKCAFLSDGTCYYRGPTGTCTRQPGVECLKPYRDGLVMNADVKFLMECAALFRMNDPERAKRLEQIAGRI